MSVKTMQARVPGSAGHQWFHLTRMDPHELERGVEAAAPLLNQFLDDELARLKLPYGSTEAQRSPPAGKCGCSWLASPLPTMVAGPSSARSATAGRSPEPSVAPRATGPRTAEQAQAGRQLGRLGGAVG